MRFFDLLNIQHFVLYLFPALVSILMVGFALKYAHFHREDSKERMTRITETYPSDIEERNAPFPLFLFLLILGTVLWGIAYILGYGLLGVKI